MKNSILTIFLGFNLCLVSGQAYKEKFKQQVCDCMDASTQPVKAEFLFQNCFQKILPKYVAQIDAEIDRGATENEYIQGQKIRLKLIEDFRIELIQSCDTYFTILDDAKKVKIKEDFTEGDSLKLEKMNQAVALQPHAMNYLARGTMLLHYGRLDEAESDIKKSIEMNAFVMQAQLLLALVQENQGQYKEAITTYDTILKTLPSQDLKILREIVVRKSKR